MIFLLQSSIIFLILLLVFYISRRKIEQGVYLIIFLLPAYLVRTELFGIPTTALELGIYVLFTIWLAKNYRHIKLGEIIPDKTLRLGIFLLLAGAAVSTIFSVDLRTSAGILKGWFFSPFLFFIILVLEIKTFEQKKNILKAFFFSGVAVAGISLLYLFFPELDGVAYDMRLRGFYLSPNYLAMYLSPALVIGVWLIFLSLRGGAKATTKQSQELQRKQGVATPSLRLRLAMTNKYILLLSIFIISVVIYFTYSYSAWIALFLAIILFLCFTAGTEKKLSFQWKLSFLSTFLILIVLLFSQIGTGKFENMANISYRSSFSSRLMILRAAWEIGKDNPLIGIGPGNFQRYYLDYQKRFTEPYLEWAAPEPHNIFLAFWLQTGILGLAGFITLVFWLIKKSSGLLKKTGDADSQGLAIVLCSLMIYTLLHGLVDTTYWKNDLAMIFWMVLGLVASIKNNSGETV